MKAVMLAVKSAKFLIKNRKKVDLIKDCTQAYEFLKTNQSMNAVVSKTQNIYSSIAEKRVAGKAETAAGLPTADLNNLPMHIGIIMDGNGRWAKQKKLPRSEGHKKGAEVFREICEYASDIGIKYLTFYAFSTENWARPEEEVAAIMNLFREFLHEAEEREEENEKKGLCMKYIGEKDALPEDIIRLANELELRSAGRNKTYINIAVNYGGRSELVQAIKKIAEKSIKGEIEAEDVNEELISSLLYTAGQPDPDLIIRPSGEFRLSNFMIWQSAYAEFWSSNVLWPDFTKEDLNRAIAAYQKRNRRFGGIG